MPKITVMISTIKHKVYW